MGKNTATNESAFESRGRYCNRNRKKPELVSLFSIGFMCVCRLLLLKLETLQTGANIESIILNTTAQKLQFDESV